MNMFSVTNVTAVTPDRTVDGATVTVEDGIIVSVTQAGPAHPVVAQSNWQPPG